MTSSTTLLPQDVWDSPKGPFDQPKRILELLEESVTSLYLFINFDLWYLLNNTKNKNQGAFFRTSSSKPPRNLLRQPTALPECPTHTVSHLKKHYNHREELFGDHSKLMMFSRGPPEPPQGPSEPLQGIAWSNPRPGDAGDLISF